MSASSGDSPIRVILADDHRLVRTAIAQLIDTFRGIKVVGEAASGPELVSMVADRPVDVVIVDAAMPSLKGFEVTRRLLESDSGVRVVIVSAYASDQFVRTKLAEGACGFIHKDAAVDDLETAIRKAAAGEEFIYPALEDAHLVDPGLGSVNPAPEWDPLTPRQREVLRLVASGYRSRAIASKLDVSVKTVEAHRAEIMRRLGVHHLAGLVQEAIRLGLVRAQM